MKAAVPKSMVSRGHCGRQTLSEEKVMLELGEESIVCKSALFSSKCYDTSTQVRICECVIGRPTALSHRRWEGCKAMDKQTLSISCFYLLENDDKKSAVRPPVPQVW